MREVFAKRNLEYICKYKNYSELDKIKIKYGLEVLYTIITKTTGILLVAILLNTLKETILLMLLYMFLRLFGHGIHAKNSSYCWVASILCYGAFPLLMKYYVIPQKYIIIMWLFAFISFLIWAPADTPKKPLVNKKKRIFDKVMTCILCICLLLISLTSSLTIISNGIFFSLIMGVVAINPLTYKIFNVPFNNYKRIKMV